MAKLHPALRYSEYWKPAAELREPLSEPQFTGLEVSGLETVFPSGVRRGAIAEVHGARSSGRTSICWQILGQATTQGEVCAVVDLFDSFHPDYAAAAGVRLNRIVWVRCGGNAEYAMRTTDLLLHAGGFGIVNLDLCDAPPRVLNRIPLSYWYRFRSTIENTPTVLLVCADTPQAKSCSKQSLQTKAKAFSWAGKAPFELICGLETHATLDKISSIRPQSLLLEAVV